MSKTAAIDGIEVGERARVDLGDLTELKNSISSLGLLQPVVITADNRLIAGHRRLESCRALGMTDVPVIVAEHITDAVDLLKAERDENTCRKPMTASELIALGRQIEALEKPRATQRQAEAGRSHGRGIASVPANESYLERHDSREKAAEAVGLSTATYSRIKQVANAADGYEESRGQRAEVTPERREESRDALELIDRITAGEEVRPADGGRPLTVSAVYEDWKGHKINRGDDAPTERRRPATTAEPLRNAYGRRYPQRSLRKAITEGIAALSGLCVGLSSVTDLDDSINADEAAQWVRDLDEAMRVQRIVRNKLKERINGKH